METFKANSKGIIIVGLGPGDPGMLTVHARQVLEACSDVYVRTRLHPAMAAIPPHVLVHSIDAPAEAAANLDVFASQVAEKVILLGERPGGVIYAVPGNPMVGEMVSPEILRRSRASGIPVQVVPGLSIFETAWGALGNSSSPNTALVDALDLAVLHVPPFSPGAPAVIAPLHTPQLAQQVKQNLLSLFPPDHQVTLLHAAGCPGELVENMALDEIDLSRNLGFSTVLYLPALHRSGSMEAFQEVIAHLRAPDGCPWDREQTHQSLRPYLLEETYEALDALDEEDVGALREELGDVLLQVVLHAQIAAEIGEFTLADVLRGVNTKIVNRHPHVFGDIKVDDSTAVVRNWERLKALERADNGKAHKGALDGVALALPALIQAGEYQKRSARFGVEMPDWNAIISRMCQSADVRTLSSSEIGEVLFAVVCLAVQAKVDAEGALRETNRRFRQHFGLVEKAAHQKGVSLSELTPEQVRDLWKQFEDSTLHE
jgi:tetrapyrrole methylase family protein/MazG family protein